MTERFSTHIGLQGLLEVPAVVVESLGPGKRPKVVVTVKGQSFRSTVAVYGGRFYLGLNKAQRGVCGAELGELVEVSLEPDTAPRVVELPAALEAALAGEPKARAAFERLSYTTRKEHAQAITSAKQEETRRRRLEKILAGLKR